MWLYLKGAINKMEQNEVKMTGTGYEEKKKRKEYLENELLPEIRARIKAARALGDLSENAEYSSAQEELRDCDAEIDKLTRELENVKIIEGIYVKLKDITHGDIVEYMVVGEAESDILEGKLSQESPLGENLKNRKVGDSITFDAPGGTITYEVLEMLTEAELEKREAKKGK